MLFTLLLASIHSQAEPAPTFDSIGKCISQAEAFAYSHDPTVGKPHAEKCMEMAEAYKSQENLRGRSLYFRSLHLMNNISFFLDANYVKKYRSDFAYYNSSLKNQVEDLNEKKADSETLSDVLNALIIAGGASEDISDDRSPALKSFKVFEELQERGLNSKQTAEQVYSNLLTIYDWNDAVALKKQWPALQPSEFPQIENDVSIGAQELGFYDLSSDLSKITLRKLELGSGPQIVISGWCHFSDDAVRALSDDLQISSIMRKNGLLVTVPGQDFSELDKFRHEFPGFEMHPIYQPASWENAGVALWNSPSFAFFVDGKLKLKFSGVPRTHGKENPQKFISQFCEGLNQIGLGSDVKACSKS